MTIEFIGMIHHRHASEIHPPGGAMLRSRLRPRIRPGSRGGAIRSRARRLFLRWSGWLPACRRWPRRIQSGWVSCSRIGRASSRRRWRRRKFATLDQITGGRAAIHVISGGDDVDQLRDGDTLPKDERYARTDEYVHILKRIWTEPGPVDHAGQYYQFIGASTAMRCVQQPHIPIYFGGASDAAIDGRR